MQRGMFNRGVAPVLIILVIVGAIAVGSGATFVAVKQAEKNKEIEDLTAELNNFKTDETASALFSAGNSEDVANEEEKKDEDATTTKETIVERVIVKEVPVYVTPPAPEPQQDSAEEITPEPAVKSNICEDVRDDYESFEPKFVSIYNRSIDLVDDLSDLLSGDDGLYALSYVKHIYNRLSATEAIYLSNAEDLKEDIESLPDVAKDKQDIVSDIKSKYKKAVDETRLAYGLSLGASKSIVEDQSLNTIESSVATLDDAQNKVNSSLALIDSANKDFGSIKLLYNDSLVINNCTSFCRSGTKLTGLSCVPVDPIVENSLPMSGGPNTVFVISGSDFGHEEWGIVIGNHKAEIVLWTNTVIRYKATGIPAGTYLVTFPNGDEISIISVHG